jgi:hypothetical protein
MRQGSPDVAVRSQGPIHSVLLRHRTARPGEIPHHDWLMPDPTRPGDPTARLWTARVRPHWRDWSALGRFELTPLPPHRRRYLHWAGPLTQRRGWVYPVGRAEVEVDHWSSTRAALTLRPDDGVALRLTLQESAGRWTAIVLPPGRESRMMEADGTRLPRAPAPILVSPSSSGAPHA